MGKKRLIDVVTVNIEGKLDSNGAIRNVAVKDAWLRLRQNIEVESWKEAEGVLQELSDNLQKINMLKSMTAQFAKLKTAFQNPTQLVEENDYVNTPREREDKTQLLQTAKDLKKVKEELSHLCTCLDDVKTKVEKENAVPDKIEIPGVSTTEIKSCYQAVAVICDKCKKGIRELEHMKKRVENSESRNKDLEKQMDEKEEKIDKLTVTIDTLEKKHSNIKEEKMENMKEQMKMKSLEKQVEVKVTELAKVKEENENLKKRLHDVLEKKSTETADMYNQFPPDKICELFRDLFQTLRKDVFDFYKASLKKTEKESADRTLQILLDAFSFCEGTSANQMDCLMEDIVNPAEKDIHHKGAAKLQVVDIAQIQNLRKQTCKYSCEFVKNAFITKLESASGEEYTFEELTGCMPYIERCVELSWVMVLQTPAMHIGFDDNSKQQVAVDKTKYEIASGKGAKVDYVLWPPLYKSKDGELMSKGVIQTK